MKTDPESGSDQIADYDDDGAISYENGSVEYFEEGTAAMESSDELQENY